MCKPKVSKKVQGNQKNIYPDKLPTNQKYNGPTLQPKIPNQKTRGLHKPHFFNLTKNKRLHPKTSMPPEPNYYKHFFANCGFLRNNIT